MSSHRFLFYVPSMAPGDDRASIDGDEHRHLTRVLRMKRGDTIFATNGTGLIVAGRVEDVGADFTVFVATDVVSEGPPSRHITLALALISKPRFEQALEQCVELGITECVPFVSSCSQVKRYGAGFIERLNRIALAAMKQSFRGTLPRVTPLSEFSSLVERCRIAADVVVGDAASPGLAGDCGDGAVVVVVGPEAGLADAERDELARLGATFASTSAYRLRSETAAVTLVAVLAGSD